MNTTFRIVVGVDGSDQAQRALDWAVAEAARRDHCGQPTTVQAIVAWQSDALAEPLGRYAQLSEPIAVADATLCAAVARSRVAHPDVAVAGIAVQGRPADVLCRASDSADLLVVGSHGHTCRSDTALGAIAAECVRGTTCPMVVIPVARASSTMFSNESVATKAG
jgi:nucleotide-binding universal stress UspA family protein